MNFIKNSVFIIGFVLFSFTTIQASILVEPYLGYHVLGEEDATNGDISGIGFGARLGFSHLGLLAGVGYELADLNYSKSGNADVDMDLQDLYAFVGYKFPVLVRIWAGYAFQSKVKYTGAELTGNGIRMGVGYTGFPFISVNLEYQTRDNFKLSDNTSVTTNFNSWFLSVSYPLEL